jgi:hypothetical protein
MVTKIPKVQQDSSIFIFGHYKCPFFIFGEWSWEKLSRFYKPLLRKVGQKALRPKA